MTQQDNIYSTSDFNLAVFLLHRGCRLYKTETQSEDKKCVFVMEIPEEVDFTSILKEWHSDETEQVKHILHLSRFLRSEIKRAYNNPAY